MANLRDIRNRIKSVKNTSQITRAMQLVAASKMKRAQDAALEGRPYALMLAEIIAGLAGRERLKDYRHPFLESREVKTRGILVVGTDRGLCGPLNSNLFRLISKQEGSVKFFSIGRKAKQFLSRSRRDLVADFTVGDKARFAEVRPLIDLMVESYLKGEIDTIEVLYPRFINTLIQEATLVDVLPLDGLEALLKRMVERGDIEAPTQDSRDIVFEPSIKDLLDDLLGLYIRKTLHQYVLNAKASEQSARMVAMKTATDNAKKLVGELTLEYNKARQAAITQEILELSAAGFAD